MTKKPARKRYKSARRSKRRQKTVNTRSIVIIFGFLLLVSFLLYGLNSLKNEVSLKQNDSYKKLINSKIEDVDRSLYETFFKLGITRNDILKESNYDAEKDGLSWTAKKQSFKLDKKYTKDEFSKALNPLITATGAGVNLESKGDSLFLEIDIEGYRTHSVEFKYKKQTSKFNVCYLHFRHNRKT